jgi:3'-phosphoadenosine 5'-phosphosulfate sulfotransferase (PAPS reductase)/FAD synthetase
MIGHDPFKVEGPALISFSGGRTSAYMLWRILNAHHGTLPDDVIATFANTGKEMPQTLDFVRDCSERWGVLVRWLEYADHDEPQRRWRQVSYETASRNGEPFKALIRRKNYLPNPVTRFCTIELKIRAMKLFAQQAMGWDDWTNVIGLRADEPGRVARSRNNSDVWTNAMPLATAGVTKRDVQAFWEGQNWGLALPSRDGVTYLGNCDLCFLKSAKTITAIINANPELADWWIEAEAEAEALASKPSGARFRTDRPSYAEIAARATSTAQGHLFPDDRDQLVDCFCGDAA